MTGELRFDAIVVGSGLTGGWAAKELTEQGLSVVMIERGEAVEEREQTEALGPVLKRGLTGTSPWLADYPIQGSTGVLNEANYHLFVKDAEHPYQTPAGQSFSWLRGYQFGGRSLSWGRLCYRWSPMDFHANAAEGLGVGWPIGYEELQPWYARVEKVLRVLGNRDGLAHLPDGEFQPPPAWGGLQNQFAATIEREFPDRRVISGRMAGPESFSTQRSTLPAAMATGRLTVLTGTQVLRVLQEGEGTKATGVEARDLKSGARVRIQAPLVFLCAGAFNSVSILLSSASEKAPAGLGNSSGMLGRGIMDHIKGSTAALMPVQDGEEIPGGIASAYIPRFRNLGGEQATFRRGYGVNSIFLPSDVPGHVLLILMYYGECLALPENRITLDTHHRDRLGLPQLHIDFRWGANDLAMFEDARQQSQKMLEAVRGIVLMASECPMPGGASIHEAGGACMGESPQTSVTNRYNQLHDVPNVFVTDGAVLSSSPCQNPSLTYMALTARAANKAAELLREGAL